MTFRFDLTDLPTVRADELALPMRLLVDGGQALLLLCETRPAEADMKRLDEAFWRHFRGDTARGHAILLRFWCLIDVLATRRLRALLLETGFAFIAPAVEAASGMRVNANWGFNPQRFLWALRSTRSKVLAREHASAQTQRLLQVAA